MLNEILQSKRVERYVSFIDWITSYSRTWLRGNGNKASRGLRPPEAHAAYVAGQIALNP